MTKKDLIRSVAQDIDVDQKLVQVAVQKTLDTMLDTMSPQARSDVWDSCQEA